MSNFNLGASMHNTLRGIFVAITTLASSALHAGQFCSGDMDDGSAECRYSMCTLCAQTFDESGCNAYRRQYGCDGISSPVRRPTVPEPEIQQEPPPQPVIIIPDSNFKEQLQHIKQEAKDEKAAMRPYRHSKKKFPASGIRDEKNIIKYLKESRSDQKELIAAMKRDRQFYGVLGRDLASRVLSIFDYELAYRNCLVKNAPGGTYESVLDSCEVAFSKYFSATQR
jgi:hypothetical protein